ncbi:MAG: GGDEF domain-containing protein [Deltaproteobacteria bacterium HGW-Deltaproteobacteria-19]|jgi:diguanylate cyclase (GGDEF)-like protein|nr:MAG: GGDEF domain-containing protein [Deltaproteobacteria bacterium HGW-Deltaproteobacteria-19]
MAVAKDKLKRLIKMADLLCASFTMEEACGVLGREMARLFPAGAFYRHRAVRDLLEAEARWGDAPGEAVFTPEECHALRRNRPHLVAGTTKGLPCRHTEGETDGRASLCVPMTVHGEFLGLLHIRFDLPPGASVRSIDAAEQLALVAAQQVRLAMKNVQLREELSGLSTRDPLTGLVNRRYLEATLERELKKAGRQGLSVGVVFIDIDHLGHINQTHGIEEGEQIIRDLGTFLGGNIRDEDIACRWGADEFVLIFPGSGLDAARRRAENLREMLKDQEQKEGHQHLRRVTLSIGVAASPQHGETAGDILQSVRGAVKRAKQEGRDRVCTAG